MSDAARRAREWAEKAEELQQEAQDHLKSPWDKWEVHVQMGKLWAQVALAETAIRALHEWCDCRQVFGVHCHACGGRSICTELDKD